MPLLSFRQTSKRGQRDSLSYLRVRTQGLHVIAVCEEEFPSPGGPFSGWDRGRTPVRTRGERVVRKKIMELKSILIPILIVGGWLVLYGVILPALGIST